MEVDQESNTVGEQDEVSGSRSRMIKFNQGGDGGSGEVADGSEESGAG